MNPQTYDELLREIQQDEQAVHDLHQEERDVRLMKRLDLSRSELRDLRGTKDLLDFAE